MTNRAKGCLDDVGRLPWPSHAEAIRRLKKDLGDRVDLTGLDLVHLIRMLGFQYDRAAFSSDQEGATSGPRWRLLLRLMAQERRDRGRGMSPGDLSRCQNVSKNTISTLLRGLEDEHLIERTLDSEDRRSFRIRLTPAGERLVRTSMPVRLARLNTLISDLSTAERKQLIDLLAKLHQSLARHTEHTAKKSD